MILNRLGVNMAVVVDGDGKAEVGHQGAVTLLDISQYYMISNVNPRQRDISRSCVCQDPQPRMRQRHPIHSM